MKKWTQLKKHQKTSNEKIKNYKKRRQISCKKMIGMMMKTIEKL